MRAVLKLMDDFLEGIFKWGVGSGKVEDEQAAPATTAKRPTQFDARGRKPVSTLRTDDPVKATDRLPASLTNDA